MTEKPRRLLPALIGGAVIGVLSIVLPMIVVGSRLALDPRPILAMACCLWGLIGGLVAAYMLVRRSPVFRVTHGNGAVVGLLAGFFGSIPMILIYVLIMLGHWDELLAGMELAKDSYRNDPDALASINQALVFARDHRVLAALLIWIIIAIIVIGLSTLGGLIGVAIFERRKTPPGPPPGYPPQYYPPQGPPPGYPPQGTPPYGGQPPPQGQPPYGGDTPPY